MIASSFRSSAGSVRCTVTGDTLPHPFELFIEFSGEIATASHAGWALPQLLLPAMMWGESELYIDAPVPAVLMENVATIQKIYGTWLPAAKRVAVRAARVVDDSEPGGTQVASFFSGGVDSLHTLIANRETLTHLVLVHGFDLLLSQDKFFASCREQAESVARAFSKKLIVARINVRDFYGKTGAEWLFYLGAVLGSIALAMDGFASAVHIASGVPYNVIIPSGSQPLLDPLWSTRTVRVVHDSSEVTRIKKVEAVAQEPAALASLRVCLQDLDSGLNCGHCEKCLRTMIALKALGRLDDCPTLPHEIDLGAMRKISLKRYECPYWQQPLDYPLDRKLRRAIESVIRTQEMGFGADYGTWKSKARRTLVLARHIGQDLAAAAEVLRP